MSALDEKREFSEFYLSEGLKRALAAVGYTIATPVQASAIPLIMAGIDLIVQSQTGTGKTAAFAIPILEMVEAQPGTVEVLVLAPTRELAKQVHEEFERLSAYKSIQSTAIYGGTAYGPQLQALTQAQVVCATPGRLLDLLKQGQINLDALRFLIIDEADEMLSMGFDRDVRAIVDELPEQRQSLLFSATITEEVNALARHILFHPEFLTFSATSMVNRDVHHSVVRVDGPSRMRDLLKIIEHEEPESAIIFANTKADTFMVHAFLKRHGYRAEVLNGDMEQKEREQTLELLRQGKVSMLVATDVAARGIDISDLSHVINYVLPESPDVYVHRTGRTGRAGKKGTAISLLANAERTLFLQIKKHCDVTIHERSLPTTEQINAAKHSRVLKRLGLALDALPQSLAYGSKLGLAKQLMVSDSPEEAARLIAKLMSLAELRTTVPAELPEEPVLAAPAPAPKPQPKPQPQPQTQPQAQPEPEPQAQPEPEPQAQPEPPAQPRPELAPIAQRAQDDREGADEADDAPEQGDAADEYGQEPGQEPGERRGRRRRRGRYGRHSREDRPERDARPGVEERAQAATAQAASPSLSEASLEAYTLAAPPYEAPLATPHEEPEELEEPAGDSAGDSAGDAAGEDRRRSRPRRGRGRRDASRESRSGWGRSGPALTGSSAGSVAPPAAPAPIVVSMGRMFVNMGRNAFSSREEFIDFVTHMSGMDAEDFGQVTLDRNHAIVEVREDYLYDIIYAIHQQDWNGRTLQARHFRD